MLHIASAGKRLLLLATALIALAAAPGRAEPVAPRPTLARFADAYARDRAFSGTLLIREHGRNLYFRSFGLADRAFSVPAANRNRYRIASITKLFTSVLVLRLADEGRLDLDAPISASLPDYPGEGAGRITLHHLLNHTSGLPQYDRVASFEEAEASGIEQYQRPQTAAQLLRRCCSGPPLRAPGSAFDYNNADYILLGRIVERVTGKSFADALAELILRPLGLDDTGLARQEAIVARLTPTYFARPDNGVLINDLPVYFQNWDAAGALYSTAEDLADFADALYCGRLLRPATLERMLRPGLDDYGYGLWSYGFERRGRTRRVAKRPGSIMGANAVLYRLLDDGVTIILLANTNRTDLDSFAQRLAEQIIDGRCSACPRPRPAAARPSRGANR